MKKNATKTIGKKAVGRKSLRESEPTTISDGIADAPPLLIDSEEVDPRGELLDKIVEAKRNVAALSEKVTELQARYLEEMDKREVTSFTNRRGIIGTVVRSTLSNYDEAAIKKKLNAAQWKSIVVETMSITKLRKAMKDDPDIVDVVASSATEVDKKPYIKITEP